MEHPCLDTDSIINRFKRVEGQVRGIIKMIEAGKTCEEILVQVGSSKAALHKAGQSILQGHLEHCVFENLKNGNHDEAMKRLSVAIEQFSRIV